MTRLYDLSDDMPLHSFFQTDLDEEFAMIKIQPHLAMHSVRVDPNQQTETDTICECAFIVLLCLSLNITLFVLLSLLSSTLDCHSV